MKNKVKKIILTAINRKGLNCGKTIDTTEIQDGDSFEFNEKAYVINYDITIIADSTEVEHHGGLNEAPYTTGETIYTVETLEVSIYDINEELINFDDDYLIKEIEDYLNGE